MRSSLSVRELETSSSGGEEVGRCFTVVVSNEGTICTILNKLWHLDKCYNFTLVVSNEGTNCTILNKLWHLDKCYNFSVNLFIFIFFFRYR
jgi:hypothetical protein